ncbi:MAG: glycoside hydrolase family 16 protein [Marinifilaceae bacterium]
MKYYLLTLITLCTMLCVQAQTYTLVWEENFNSTQLDTAVWSKIPRGRSDWNNYMSSYDSLYAVANGNLILRGICNTTQTADTARYLTGGVYTKDKKLFTTGRIEISARFNSAQGAWPALWMLPEKAKWPNGGEIDIMEHLNYDKFVYQTVHTHYTYTLGKTEKPKNHGTAPIAINNYNTYAVDITKDKLSFYVNGQLTFIYPRIPALESEGQYPFTDEPFYLLMDMQLGGAWVGQVNPNQLPVEMHIDWVRYYSISEQ